MALKAGYKQTEVGVIPEDWEALSLSQTARGIFRGASPRPIEDPIWFDDSSDVGWVRISDVTKSGRGLTETTQRLSKQGILHSRFVPSGSLIMSICATVGRPIETRLDVCIHDGFVVFDRPLTDQSYLYHVLKDLEPRWASKGQTGSQMNLNGNLIKSTIVPVPPTKSEQEAIAEALSDADALIESLDQLITKKRGLKQGAMQQLLTGQTRFPGFSGEWDVKRLGNVLQVRHGKSQHEVVVSGGLYPILATGGEIGRTNVFLYDKPSVLIGRKGTIDKPQFRDSPFWTVDTLFFTELFNSVNPKFIYFKFLMIDWRSYNEASGVPSLNASTIENIEVTVPPLEEQSAIATILSDMDTELAELESRLAKARHIKQGMMQELLTGRIRLL